MRYALLVLFAAMLACGQILFKKAAIEAGNGPAWSGLVNIWTLIALIIYAFGTVLWLAILRTTPLSVAYPFTALGFVLVPLGARLMFGETLDTRYMAGVGLILIGIMLTSPQA
jgi:undecaprenyl phosphate-alpha-L-ara4N flippase subunit ArnE